MVRSVPWEKIPGDNMHCHYCGVFLDLRNRTRDHVVPRALGGTQALVNLCHSCVACNNAKADATDWCDCWRCNEAVAYFHTLNWNRGPNGPHQ